MKYAEQKELVDGLRAMADFFEQHIELPCPNIYVNSWIYDESKYDREALTTVVTKTAKDKAVEIARSLKPVEKNYDNYALELIKRFSKSIKVTYKVSREEVCTKVVTGTKEVPERIYVETGRTVQEDVVEWQCDPLLS